MKNKVVIAVIIAFFGLILFIFFAAEPTGNQAFFEPVSVFEIEPMETQTENKKLFPFVSADFFGFFDAGGKVVFAKEQNNEFSLSDSIWTNYTFRSPYIGNASSEVQAEKATIFSSNGTELFSVEAKGALHLSSDRVFVFLPSGNSVGEYNKAGKLLWTYSMPGIITAFACNDEFTVIGSSDGYIVFLDKTGAEKFCFYPGGSKVEIIYSLAISRDGKRIACLCGLDKQRLMLFEANDYHKTIFHAFLKEGLRKQANMFFDEDSKYLFSETAEGIAILNCKKLVLTQTNIQGRLTNHRIKTSSDNFVLLTQKTNKAYLTLFDSSARQLAQTNFNCTLSSMVQNENSFYLIIDNKLLTFKLNRE
ncbi:MAG: hypothetical protein P1P64_02220 [Treponemataceae bacterium]